MALCEHCRAELDGRVERLQPPWFDQDRHAVAGKRVRPTVWLILEILYRRRRGRPVSTDSLMTLLYEGRPDDPPNDKIIQVFVCLLRKALLPTPFAIQTTWNVGFTLVERREAAL
jgi:DNA-binding response OmpR family regulator